MPYFPMPDARHGHDKVDARADVPEDMLAQVLSASRGEHVAPEDLRPHEVAAPPVGDALAQLREHSTQRLQAYMEAMGRHAGVRDGGDVERETAGAGAELDALDAVDAPVQSEHQIQAAKRPRVPRAVAGAFSANAHYVLTQRGSGKADEAHNVLSLGI